VRTAAALPGRGEAVSEIWFDPIDVIADSLFEPGEAVLALMENGETISLFYGHLSSSEDDLDCWMGFYNEDGEEVFKQDIKSVRPLGPSAQPPAHRANSTTD
jgi:hypothetical protein